MKMKKTIGILTAMIALVAVPAFAQTTASTTTASSNVTASIACVGTAVDARETTIDTAINAHSAAVTAAYTARATALQQAYKGATKAQVNRDVKAAWSTFSKATKAANTAWKTSHNSAWSTFKTASKACKAPSGVSDSTNSTSEVSVQ